jgi:hypothetical protein
METYSITFETKCYENDWQYLLKTKYLDTMIERCQVNFQTKQLIINNVKDREKVRQYAEEKVNQKIIDVFYFAEDYRDEVLKYYNIKEESFGRGYYYSIAELVGLYLSKTKYHLHFSSDSFMSEKSKKQWIIEAYHIMEEHPEYIVANAAWNFLYRDAKKESIEGTSGERRGNFYAGYGFSDQCYLARTDTFKTQIYNYTHPASSRYPIHGGESFEKRVDAYMQSNSFQRLTSMRESYMHINFPVSERKGLVLAAIRWNLYDPYCKVRLWNRNRIKAVKRTIRTLFLNKIREFKSRKSNR